MGEASIITAPLWRRGIWENGSCGVIWGGGARTHQAGTQVGEEPPSGAPPPAPYPRRRERDEGGRAQVPRSQVGFPMLLRQRTLGLMPEGSRDLPSPQAAHPNPDPGRQL